MRALVLCGSGRRDGFTSAMCSGAEDVLREAGWEAEVIRPSELAISHCDSCGGCFSGGGCVKRDGMDAVYEAFSEADLLILSSPVHFSGPSSAIKIALDRFDWIWHIHGFRHPALAAGLVCGGSDVPSFRCVLSVFRSFAAAAGSEWAGDLCLGGTDRGDSEYFRRRSGEFTQELLERAGGRR